MKRTSIGLAIAIVMWAGSVRADDGAGAFRLALSGDLVGWQKVSFGGVMFPDGTRGPGGSVERLRLGILDPRLGIDLGGAIIPELLVGVTVAVARTEETTFVGEVDSIDWRALAWLEGVFLHGEDVRPFVRGSIGGGGSARNLRMAMSSTSTTDTLFALALTAGVHFFASQDVSISPWVQVGYEIGTSESGLPLAPVGGPAQRSLELVTLALGVSLAGWIGGEYEHVVERRAEHDDAAIGRSRQRATTARATAVPARPAVPDADTFRSDLGIAGTARSLLASRPSVDGRNIQFGFSIISASPRFAGCQDMELAAERASVTVPMRVTQQPFELDVEETVVLTVTHAQLEVLAGAQPRLIACGETIELDLSVRAAIGAYIRRFRSMAHAAGTLDPGVFVPPEPVPAEVPGRDDALHEESDAGTTTTP